VHIDVEKIQVFFLSSFSFLPSSLSEAWHDKNVVYSADKHVILAFLCQYWFAAVVARCGDMITLQNPKNQKNQKNLN
jgi:hypothetical protein